MHSKPSLLLITYKFPPMQSVSCHRTWGIYQGLQKYFENIHVITTSNRHLLPQTLIDTSSLPVSDVKTIDYRTLLQRKGRTAVARETTKKSVVGRFLLRLQSSFPTLYLFGEGGLYYIRNAVTEATRIIDEKQITHVLSSFPPYADHIIAYRLKMTHPQLCWIADFRDLHVDPAQDNLLWRSYQAKINKEILAHADIVTTVSEGLAEHLEKMHDNVYVLRNGIRESADEPSGLYPKFTISYTGSMFQDKRRVDPFLAALRQLMDSGVVHPDQVHIVYAGKDSAVWWPLIRKFQLEDVFTDRSMVSEEEARAIQVRSHINVLLTYSTNALSGNLTGKLFDYLGARRPILVCINGPKDAEIESVIDATHAGIVTYAHEIDRIAAFITEQYRARESGSATAPFNEEALRTMHWPSLLQHFIEQKLPNILSAQ